MKRVFALVLALIMSFSLSACGEKTAGTTNIPNTPTSAPGKTTPDEAADVSPSEEAEPNAPEDVEVCYLPVRIISATDIPEEAADHLGVTSGHTEEIVASYEYDDAGRLVRYETDSCAFSLQYLDEIALPAVFEWNELEIIIYFTEPRWVQDASEIVLDVRYSAMYDDGMDANSDSEVIPADFRLGEIQLDKDGKLMAAVITWESQIGEEAYYIEGHTFDDNGNLIFLPPSEEDFGEHVYQYGADGQIVGVEYWVSFNGETRRQEAVWVDEDGRSIHIETLSDYGEYTDMGDGRYRYEGDGFWNEIVLDENGNLSQYRWQPAVSEITYIHMVEYESMPISQYAGTPLDYSSIYPMLHDGMMEDNYYEGVMGDNCIERAGTLQLPVAVQLILQLFGW